LLDKTGPTSTHILLYGDPGTGKTSYAKGLIRALKQTGYQIVRDEENKSSNRRAAIVACLNLTRQEPRPIIIVDEAELKMVLGEKKVVGF
jgi:replication-associated recombination protein RarA